MSRSQRDFKPFIPFFVNRGGLLTVAFFWLVGLAPAQADWLVTLDGELIETVGEWTIEDGSVIFVDPQGEIRRLSLEDVDLEASKETTALKAGRTYEPPAKDKALEEPPAELKAPEPKVTLYMTTWCGYCRRTRELLEKLDVDFAEKDIEKDAEAAREYREKGQGYRGIPLLDVDGQIVKGFSAQLIHRLVSDLKRKEAAARQTASTSS